MARAIFKRPVRIDGTSYEAGREHELAPAVVGHWYVKALVKDGLAQIIEDPKPEPKPEPKSEAPTVAPEVKPVVKPTAVKPAAKPPQHNKPVKRSGKK